MHKFIFTIENTYENNNYNNLIRIHDKTKIFIDTHMWPTGSSTERSICACVAPITLTSCRGVHKMAETPPQIGGNYELMKLCTNYIAKFHSYFKTITEKNVKIIMNTFWILIHIYFFESCLKDGKRLNCFTEKNI